MFRTFARKFLPNPLDRMLKKTKSRSGKKILLGWNRGLGDIALGLFAIVKRIREFIPDAEITFLVRKNLLDGFTLLEGVQTIEAPNWVRGKKVSLDKTLQELGIDPSLFDLIIENPSPTDWVRWQRGILVPTLQWNASHDELWKKFHLPDGYRYIGVQPEAETQYGFWRNWPLEKYKELFFRLSSIKDVKVLLFGFDRSFTFDQDNIIDLRGKTSLFELLSIIKNRCMSLVLPDSGILSLSYYLNVESPIRVVSLWADPDHGILKQNVPSPNPKLIHTPLLGAHRDLSSLQATTVLDALFPHEPLRLSASSSEVEKKEIRGVGAILLAGGQGSRLGWKGPKGTFPILGKSLFEWIIEKTPLQNFPIAVMTSEENHDATLQFFKEHGHFNRELYFFKQGSRPLLDPKGHPLDLKAPEGNGSFFRSFQKSGLLEVFQEKGIDLLTICPVENPLADPSDAKLITYHREKEAEITLKCFTRESPDEKKGVLVEREGHIEVLEYLFLSPSQTYFYNYSGMLSINLDLLAQLSLVDLPLHYVLKKHPIKNENVLKGETFIFEAFGSLKRVFTLSFPKKECYAPLKSLENLSQVEQILSQELRIQ